MASTNRDTSKRKAARRENEPPKTSTGDSENRMQNNENESAPSMNYLNGAAHPSLPAIADWNSDCDWVTDGGHGQPEAWCDTDTHLEAEILEHWRESLNGHVYQPEQRGERERLWKRRIKRDAWDRLKADPEYHKAELIFDDVFRPLANEMKAMLDSTRTNTAYAAFVPPPWWNLAQRDEVLRWCCEAAWKDFCQYDRNRRLLESAQNLGAVLNELPEVPPPENPAGMMLVKDYLTMFAERAARPFIWEETLYAGAFNMLVGRPFAGKSSFAAALLRAVALEQPLMGRQCKAVTCGYLALERNGAVVAKLLADWGLSDKVLFADEIAAENAIDFIEAEVKRHSLGFLVIDHLQHATRITESSSYSEVSNALMPYQAIARTSGCCILALHHQGKPDKTERDREPDDNDPIEAMGSEAYRGASDTLMEASKFHGKYYLRVHTRTGSDLPRMETNLDFETGELTATNPAEAEIQSAEQRITTFLFRSPQPMTEAEIRKNVQGDTTAMVSALRKAVKEGVVTRAGKGGKTDPFRYSVALNDEN